MTLNVLQSLVAAGVVDLFIRLIYFDLTTLKCYYNYNETFLIYVVKNQRLFLFKKVLYFMK